MVKIPYKNPKFDFPEVDREVDRGPRDRDLKFSTATDRGRVTSSGERIVFKNRFFMCFSPQLFLKYYLETAKIMIL